MKLKEAMFSLLVTFRQICIHDSIFLVECAVLCVERVVMTDVVDYLEESHQLIL
jgi:hypothetical protein